MPQTAPSRNGAPAPPPEHVRTVAAWLGLFAPPGGVCELRALGHNPSGRWSQTVVGYYDSDHLAGMAAEALRLDGHSEGVYFTLNPLKPELLARRANRAAPAKGGAGDADVTARRWLLVDCDAVRVSGIGSTDAEKAAARAVVDAVRRSLDDAGWPAPVLADSGNGYHLLYRIDLPADDGGLVPRCLKALAARFNTGAVKVDAAVGNPGRICKLYGTLARKGDDTPDRPHRRSKVLEVPGCPERKRPDTPDLRPVARALLDALAAEVPAPAARPAGGRTPGGDDAGTFRHRLDVAKWLLARGVGFAAGTAPDGRAMWRLDHCPFDPAHVGKEVAVFQDAAGKLGFHCFHDGCAGRDWRQAKERIGPPDPGHYDPPMTGGRVRVPIAVVNGQFAKVTNYQTERVEVGDGKEKSVPVPLPAGAPAGVIRRASDGWPRRVGGLLFVPGADGGPLYLERTADLFGWLQRICPAGGRSNWVDWRGGAGFVSKDDFAAYLRQTAECFDAVAAHPHEPPLPGHYYMHPPLSGGDGRALAELLARFKPATAGDAALVKGFFLSLVAGLPPGARPAWLFTAAEGDDAGGRGVGKSTLVQLAGRLVGGCLSAGAHDDMDGVKTRLLSPDGRRVRVVLLDNVKTLKFSWDELEGFVTADVVSGRQLFVGEGRVPNAYTVAVTLNGASLSKDMAQRVVVVKLARPDYAGDWREDAERFIDARRWDILGDLVAELRRPAAALEGHCRWGAWESAVLARLPDPAGLQRLVAARQADIDDDDAEAEHLRTTVVAELKRRGHDPDREAVWVPSAIMAAWANAAAGERRPTAKATAYVKTLGVQELSKSDYEGQRGWCWRGRRAGPDVRMTDLHPDSEAWAMPP